RDTRAAAGTARRLARARGIFPVSLRERDRRGFTYAFRLVRGGVIGRIRRDVASDAQHPDGRTIAQAVVDQARARALTEADGRALLDHAEPAVLSEPPDPALHGRLG